MASDKTINHQSLGGFVADIAKRVADRLVEKGIIGAG